MSYHIQLRTQIPALSSATDLRINREKLTIFGVNAMTAGVEALGHRMATDQRTLEMMASLAAAKGKPIRARFGHPGISEQSMGKQIGRTSNYRVAGNQLLYDLELLEVARTSPAFAQDPIEYILQMAHKHPTDIATSVVIETGAVWVLSDGTEIDAFTDDGGRVKRPETATSKSPIMRPVTFYYTDLVQEGAVTHDGLFGAKFFSSGASSYAEDLFRLADSWRAAYGISLADLPKKIDQLMIAYTNSRTTKGQNLMEMQEGAFADVASDDIAQGTDTTTALGNIEVMLADLAAEDSQAGDSTLPDRLRSLEQQVASLAAAVEQVVAANITLKRRLKVLEGEPFANTPVPTKAPTSFSRNPTPDFWSEGPTTAQQPQSAGVTSQPAQPNPTSQAMQRQLNRQRRFAVGQ